MSSGEKMAGKYSGFEKTHGPPHWRHEAQFDPIESNEILQNRGINPEDVVHPKTV